MIFKHKMCLKIFLTLQTETACCQMERFVANFSAFWNATKMDWIDFLNKLKLREYQDNTVLVIQFIHYNVSETDSKDDHEKKEGKIVDPY